jgi:hypothetical protein
MNNKRIAEEDLSDFTETKKQHLSEEEEEESDNEFDIEEYIGFLEDINFESVVDTLGEMSLEEAERALAKVWTMKNLRKIIKECVLSCFTSDSTNKNKKPGKNSKKKGSLYTELRDAILEVMEAVDEPEGVNFGESPHLLKRMVDALTEKLFNMKDDVESSLDSLRDEIKFMNANEDELEQ